MKSVKNLFRTPNMLLILLGIIYIFTFSINSAIGILIIILSIINISAGNKNFEELKYLKVLKFCVIAGMILSIIFIIDHLIIFVNINKLSNYSVSADKSNSITSIYMLSICSIILNIISLLLSVGVLVRFLEIVNKINLEPFNFNGSVNLNNQHGDNCNQYIQTNEQDTNSNNKVCPSCGNPIIADNKFCLKCGEKIN